MWTMVFTVTKQVSTLVYEGDLRWLAEPSEQDFGRGVRFQLFAGTKGRMEGKETLPGPKDERTDDEKKKDPKAGKDVDKAKKAAAKRDEAKPDDKLDDKPEKPPRPVKPEKLKHLPDDAYDRVPRMGKFAEGELLG
jgi:hypothetical protein